ncbi:Wzz/FepE/Etk N-terminal domain-containing protein [Prolixibacteraceae bacterium Z1-6]|uniref:Wzz/FepE/Etk N-terminal domain-containing protein n=1 Tax=Draconibacterium aestuarii TaxID=2998507 RepID=A0A9X3J487_9BACT|nr:Wzz/FepE/Etk N-terminal domain-containing protein [Prolixibacteraceae bacterium Z1-6]
MTDEIKNQQIQDDEIDLIALAKTIWEGRKLIIRTVLIFMVLGVTVALLTPKQYTASTTMVPQVANGSSKMGGLSSLAAMAGFNLNMSQGSSELTPMIYPQILSSAPFQLEMMNTPFKFPDLEQPVSIFEYYTEIKEPGVLANVKKYTLGLPFVLLKAMKGTPAESNALASGNLIAFTKDQEEISKRLSETISLDVNDKDGYLTLAVQAEDARLAAQVAQKALELLQNYITTFKVEKASAQLKFIEERYNENKAEFEKAQAVLADFRDKNKNVTSARARTQEERLQSDYQLAFNVFSELAKQLEQARIQVKEDTPVFSIVKPVTVPIEKSKPNRPMILIIWTFMGGVIAIGWIFGKEFLVSIREKWNEE